MIIALVGCDGAGKTTQVNRLTDWLSREGRETEVLDKKHILRPDILPECRFIEPDFPKLRACVSEMNGPARALFWFWAIGLSLSKADFSRAERIFLLDGYWMKQAAAEIAYGCDEGWILGIVSAFPKPDRTIYLDVSPEDALARKAERTPYECGRSADLDAGAFLAHQARVRARLLDWRERFGWDALSTTAGPDEVSLAIERLIRPMLAKTAPATPPFSV